MAMVQATQNTQITPVRNSDTADREVARATWGRDKKGQGHREISITQMFVRVEEFLISILQVHSILP